MPSAGRIREWFTEEDQDNLVAYIARNNPPKAGRSGNRLYIQLYENLDNEWPWSTRHSWQSWRNQYDKNQGWYDHQIKKYQKKHGIKRDPLPVKPSTSESTKRPPPKRVKIDPDARERERDHEGASRAGGSKHVSKVPKENGLNDKQSSTSGAGLINGRAPQPRDIPAKKKAAAQENHDSQVPRNSAPKSTLPHPNGTSVRSPSHDPEPSSTSQKPPVPPSPAPSPTQDQARKNASNDNSLALPALLVQTDTQVLPSPTHSAARLRGFVNVSTTPAEQPSPSLKPSGVTRAPLKRKRAPSVDEEVFGTPTPPPPAAPPPSVPPPSGSGTTLHLPDAAPPTRSGPSPRTLPRNVRGPHGVSLEDSRGRPRPPLRDSVNDDEDEEDGGGSQTRKTWPPVRGSQQRSQQESQTPKKSKPNSSAQEPGTVKMQTVSPQTIRPAPGHRSPPAPSQPERAHHPFSQVIPPPPHLHHHVPDADYTQPLPPPPLAAAGRHPFSQTYSRPSSSSASPTRAATEQKRGGSRREMRALLGEYVRSSSNGAALAGPTHAQRDQGEELNGTVEPMPMPILSPHRQDQIDSNVLASAIASSSKITLDAPVPPAVTSLVHAPAGASPSSSTPRSAAKSRATSRRDMRELGKKIIDGSYSPWKKSGTSVPDDPRPAPRSAYAGSVTASASPEKVAVVSIPETEVAAASQPQPQSDSSMISNAVPGSSSAPAPAFPNTQHSTRRFTPPSMIDASPFRIPGIPASTAVTKSAPNDESVAKTSITTTAPLLPSLPNANAADSDGDQSRGAPLRHLDPDLTRRRQTFGGYDTSSQHDYAPSIDFVALEKARSRSRGSSSTRGVSDSRPATGTAKRRKRTRVSLPATLHTPQIEVDGYNSDSGSYPQPLFPSVSRLNRLDQDLDFASVSASDDDALPSRRSLSSNLSVLSLDLPSRLSPADRTLSTMHGYSHIIARMAAHHGFTVETVRAWHARTGDLRETDEALRDLHDIVARHEDGVFTRVRRQSRARRASETGMFPYGDGAEGTGSSRVNAAAGMEVERWRSAPQMGSIATGRGARWAAEIEDESTPAPAPRHRLRPKISNDANANVSGTTQSRTRTSASGLRYEVVSSGLESRGQSSDYEPPKQTRAALWKRMSMEGETEAAPDEEETQGMGQHEENEDRVREEDRDEDERDGAEAEEMLTEGESGDGEEDSDVEMERSEVHDILKSADEEDDQYIDTPNGADSKGEIEASIRMTSPADEGDYRNGEPETPMAIQGKEPLQPRQSVLRRAMSLFSGE